MRFRRKRLSAYDLYGMSEQDFQDLARYNTEVYRGVLHTERCRERLGGLQQRFDATYEADR